MSYKQLSEADELNEIFITPRDEEYTPLTATEGSIQRPRANSETTSQDDISPDLERLLHTNPNIGLDDQAVLDRQTKFGKNEITEKKRNKLLHFLSFCTYLFSYILYNAWRLPLVPPIDLS
jgi:H+-transporting ATPase